MRSSVCAAGIFLWTGSSRVMWSPASRFWMTVSSAAWPGKSSTCTPRSSTTSTVLQSSFLSLSLSLGVLLCSLQHRNTPLRTALWLHCITAAPIHFTRHNSESYYGQQWHMECRIISNTIKLLQWFFSAYTLLGAVLFRISIATTVTTSTSTTISTSITAN